MTRSMFVPGVCVVLVCLAFAWVFSLHSEVRADTPAAFTFSGKPVYVEGKDNVKFELDGAEVRPLGERKFIVGRVLKDSPYNLTPNQPFEGATVWVPVDAITMFIELPPAK